MSNLKNVLLKLGYTCIYSYSYVQVTCQHEIGNYTDLSVF